MSDIINISNSAVQKFFKTDYLDLMQMPLNMTFPTWGLIKHATDAVGDVQSHGVPFSDAGGFSSGKIGDSSDMDFQVTNYTLKQIYMIEAIDSKTINLSARDEGAFERLVSYRVANMNKALNRHMDRILFGDGTGALGTITAVTTSGSDHTCTISAATWVRHRFRRRDLLNVQAIANGVYRVKSMDPANKKVVITQISGSYTPVVNDKLYIQEAKDNEPQGLEGVLDATTGSKYNITIGDSWQATQKTTSNKKLDIDYIAAGYLDTMDESNAAPNCLVVSKDQYRKLLVLADGMKLLSYQNVASGQDVVLGNVPHLFMEGTKIPIVLDFMVPAGRAYLLNKDFIFERAAGKGEFVKGTEGFLHYEGVSSKNDRYSMIYRKYLEIFIPPTFHCVFSSLSTT